MTRTRNQGVEVIIEQNKVVSTFLANQYFDLCKEVGREVTCAICLESWLDCRRCALLLRCGHAFHSSCWLASTIETCAVCRE